MSVPLAVSVVAFTVMFHTQRMAHLVCDDVRALQVPALEYGARVELVAHSSYRRHADDVIHPLTAFIPSEHTHGWD